MLTCPQLTRTLRRPMQDAYEIGLHDVVGEGHAPVLYGQVLLTIHLLEDGIAQRLVEALNISYAMVLMGDAGLQLNRRIALLGPSIDDFRDELVIKSQDMDCVTCVMHIDTQRFELYF